MVRPTIRITIALGLAATMTAVAARLTADSPQVVQIRDDCDPATFNAAVGTPDNPTPCIGGGDTTFNDFIAELTATKVVEDWRFNPDHMSEPRAIVAHNRGGETHSFTKVAEFGGGIIPPLNALSGNTKLAGECFLPGVGKTFVGPGQDLDVPGVAGGD